jgi:cell division septation protein DedD
LLDLINIRHKNHFLFILIFIFMATTTFYGCSGKPDEEVKVTKRMKIKYPPAKKAPPKKKAIKKKVVTKKPSVKWVNPKKATIKKKATAKKVAPKKTVITKKTTVAKKTTPKVAPKPRVVAEPNYVVSIASFKERSKAVALRDKLSRGGYGAYVTETTKDGVKWYRVRYGFFEGYSEATAFKNKLVKKFQVKGAWVDKPNSAEVREFAK